MTALKRNNGFSAIELLIVVVVICILATLVFVNFDGVKKKDRDTTRKQDISDIHNQLEAYYAQNGSYPTLNNMNDSNWRLTNMKNLKSDELKDPLGKSQTLVAAPQNSAYAYSVTPPKCDNSSVDCSGYTLTATLEGGGTYGFQSSE